MDKTEKDAEEITKTGTWPEIRALEEETVEETDEPDAWEEEDE